jgi:ATP-dependent Clp protease ATP-binding subunit ClpA
VPPAVARAPRRWDPEALFERFTEQARQVVVLAREEARTFKHDHIGTEHLLLGLLRERDGVGVNLLESLDVTVERVRGEVVRIVGVGEEAPPTQMPFSPEAKHVLERALQESLGLGHTFIGTDHILLGLVSDDAGPSGRILRDCGIEPEQLHRGVIERLSASHAQSRAIPGVRAITGPADPYAPFRIGPSAAVRRVLMTAAARALEQGRQQIEPRDVLLALTQDEHLGPVLADLGADEAAVRRTLDERL